MINIKYISPELENDKELEMRLKKRERQET
jgi:hypothetical protein